MEWRNGWSTRLEIPTELLLTGVHPGILLRPALLWRRTRAMPSMAMSEDMMISPHSERVGIDVAPAGSGTAATAMAADVPVMAGVATSAAVTV